MKLTDTELCDILQALRSQIGVDRERQYTKREERLLDLYAKIQELTLEYRQFSPILLNSYTPILRRLFGLVLSFS